MSAPTTDIHLLAALSYSMRGWRVFPLEPNGKRPVIAEWQHRATTDPEQIVAWWTETPDANIALVTGRESGVVAVDIDVKQDKAGAQALAALESEHGKLPRTLEQTTWSGGRHLLFAWAEGARNSVSKVGKDIDVRGDGGYIVVAPSVVIEGESTGTYEWVDSTAPVAEMPAWLFELVVGRHRRSGEAVQNLREGLLRNVSLTSIAGSLRRRGLEAEEIEAMLAALNQLGLDPLPGHEVTAIARSVSRYEPDAEDDDPGGERFTDMANAVRLAEEAANKAVHVDVMRDRWFIFDSTRLVDKPKTAMVAFVKRVARKLYMEASGLAGEAARLEAVIASGNVAPGTGAQIETLLKRAARLHAGAQRLESRDGCYAAIDLAKAEPALMLDVNQLDAHPAWMNTPSGTLDLETGKVWPHRFEDHLTKVTRAAYDPLASAPTWEHFLVEVLPDPEVRAFMQRSIGYALTDWTMEQCLWFLYGRGRNGKTTFVNAIRHVLGDYAASTQATTLMVKKHGDERRNDIAVLRGARFVSATEAEDGQHVAEGLIKQMTGQDPVTARLLYAEFFTFVPTFKIMLAANHKPTVRGTDLGIWRRIHLVPWEVTVPEVDVDPDLPSKVNGEASGILNWAIEGFREWRRIGLQAPAAVQAATAEYRAEQDPLAEFLEACVIVDEGGEVKAERVYEAYTNWAMRVGVRFPMKQKTLGLQLQDLGFRPWKGTGGVRFWRGLRLKV